MSNETMSYEKYNIDGVDPFQYLSQQCLLNMGIGPFDSHQRVRQYSHSVPSNQKASNPSSRLRLPSVSRSSQQILSLNSTYESQESNRSSFLNLPQELRLKIYGYVFDSKASGVFTYPLHHSLPTATGILARENLWATKPWSNCAAQEVRLIEPRDEWERIRRGSDGERLQDWYLGNGNCCSALLRTCWLIYAEALPILYARSPLHLSAFGVRNCLKETHLESLLYNLPVNALSMFRTLEISTLATRMFGGVGDFALRDMTALRTVNILIDCDQLFDEQYGELHFLAPMSKLSRRRLEINHTFIPQRAYKDLGYRLEELWILILRLTLFFESFTEQVELSSPVAHGSNTLSNLDWQGVARLARCKSLAKHTESIVGCQRGMSKRAVASLVQELCDSKTDRSVELNEDDKRIIVHRPRATGILCTNTYCIQEKAVLRAAQQVKDSAKASHLIPPLHLGQSSQGPHENYSLEFEDYRMQLKLLGASNLRRFITPR